MVAHRAVRAAAAATAGGAAVSCRTRGGTSAGGRGALGRGGREDSSAGRHSRDKNVLRRGERLHVGDLEESVGVVGAVVDDVVDVLRCGVSVSMMHDIRQVVTKLTQAVCEPSPPQVCW